MLDALCTVVCNRLFLGAYRLSKSLFSFVLCLFDCRLLRFAFLIRIEAIHGIRFTAASIAIDSSLPLHVVSSEPKPHKCGQVLDIQSLQVAPSRPSLAIRQIMTIWLCEGESERMNMNMRLAFVDGLSSVYCKLCRDKNVVAAGV
jgi:hypothetical protein